MPVPDYETLMLPVLRVAEKGETRILDCVPPIAAEFRLSAEDLAQMLPSGRATLVYNRVHWAKTYLLQAGLLESPRRGVFVATERGRTVLTQKPPRIDVRFLRQFKGFVDFERRSAAAPQGKAEAPVASPEAGTPEERIEAAYQVIAAGLREEVLRRVQQGSPRFFEQVVIDLLVGMGYGGKIARAGRVVGGSHDHGIDGVVDQDALGLDVVYVQAKRYKPDSVVSEEQVHGFSGALGGRGATKGVFVTTSRFSESARRFAETVKHQKIVLIDGEKLSELLVEHGIGVRTDRAIALKKIDIDYFEGEEGADEAATPPAA